MTEAVTDSEDEEPSNVHEWVLDAVRKRTAPNPGTDNPQNHQGDLWTSRQRLTSDGRKFSVPYDTDTVDAAIDDLVDDGELFEWIGMLCPTDDEHLRAVIEAERHASVTRAILVGQVNELRQEQRDQSDASTDDQPAAQEVDSDE